MSEFPDDKFKPFDLSQSKNIDRDCIIPISKFISGHMKLKMDAGEEMGWNKSAVLSTQETSDRDLVHIRAGHKSGFIGAIAWVLFHQDAAIIRRLIAMDANVSMN